MDVKKLLILIALTLPGWLLAQNYADYKLYASYNFEQGTAEDEPVQYEYGAKRGENSR